MNKEQEEIKGIDSFVEEVEGMPTDGETPIPTEAEMLRMAREANAVQRQQPTTMLEICGKKWPLRPISMRQSLAISNLSFDAVAIQEEVKKEGLSARRMKRLNAKLRKLGAKMAAHYVIGLKRRWIPFLYAVTWRRIFNMSEEVSATINATKALGRVEESFYMANLQCLVNQLALSMRQVGESVEQMQKRKESAGDMEKEDLTKEGNKSSRPSKRPKTTRR